MNCLSPFDRCLCKSSSMFPCLPPFQLLLIAYFCKYKPWSIGWVWQSLVDVIDLPLVHLFCQKIEYQSVSYLCIDSGIDSRNYMANRMPGMMTVWLIGTLHSFGKKHVDLDLCWKATGILSLPPTCFSKDIIKIGSSMWLIWLRE